MMIKPFIHKRGPLVSAHRGFSKIAPENTMPALQAAFDAGANLAEIDVRMTADGGLVLMHDALVDRTTSGSGLLSALSLSEVKQLDAGSWFERSYTGTSVPTLDEVLDWSRGRLALLIELKNSPDRDPAFIVAFIDAIERNNAEDFVIPSCFDHPTLAELHRRRPQWLLEMIVPCRLVDPVHAARAAGANLLSLEPEYTVAEDVEVLHAAELAVLTTATSLEQGRVLLQMGVDIVESDDVELATSTLRESGYR
jgi:glycerophosphoryl diester phosphodiesterase